MLAVLLVACSALRPDARGTEPQVSQADACLEAFRRTKGTTLGDGASSAQLAAALLQEPGTPQSYSNCPEGTKLGSIIKKGDTVKVKDDLTSVHDATVRGNVGWYPNKGNYLGQVGRVVGSDWVGSGLRIRFADGRWWSYDCGALLIPEKDALQESVPPDGYTTCPEGTGLGRLVQRGDRVKLKNDVNVVRDPTVRGDAGWSAQKAWYLGASGIVIGNDWTGTGIRIRFHDGHWWSYDCGALYIEKHRLFNDTDQSTNFTKASYPGQLLGSVGQFTDRLLRWAYAKEDAQALQVLEDPEVGEPELERNTTPQITNASVEEIAVHSFAYLGVVLSRLIRGLASPRRPTKTAEATELWLKEKKAEESAAQDNVGAKRALQSSVDATNPANAVADKKHARERAGSRGDLEAPALRSDMPMHDGPEPPRGHEPARLNKEARKQETKGEFESAEASGSLVALHAKAVKQEIGNNKKEWYAKEQARADREKKKQEDKMSDQGSARDDSLEAVADMQALVALRRCLHARAAGQAPTSLAPWPGAWLAAVAGAVGAVAAAGVAAAVSAGPRVARRREHCGKRLR